MSKSLLRAVVVAAALIAAVPGAAFAASVDLNINTMTGTPDPITLGTGNVTYTVGINNASTTTGTNVVLTNTLPASSIYVSSSATSSGTCSPSGSTVTCSWASIPAGNFYSATIIVTPTAGGALTLSSSVTGTESDPNTINNSASKAVIVNSQIDLGISSMTVSPDPITLGTGNVQFLVQFTNNSTSQATNAVLTSTIPASSTFVSATTPVGSGSCSQSGGTVTCNWASIGPGSTYYAYITVTPTAGGVLTLSSNVSATQSDPNSSNNSGSKAVTVNSQIDLGITSMTVSPDPMTLGTGDVQFLVQYSNASTSQATNVVLTSTIPASSTFVSATTPVGSGTCTQSGGTVTCNWATIGPGSTYYAYITVTPTAAGSLSLTSTVSAAQSDPNTSNNSGTKAVTVNSQIDLAISSMTVSPDPITLGTGDVQYLVQFANNSTSQATNAVLTSTIPVNSTFVSATTPVGSGSCSQSAGTVTCNWPTIGASQTYYAYITVTPTAGGVLTLSSSVSATQSDPNTSNNSGSKAVTVNSQIDLGISSMTVSPDPITLGTGNVQFLVQYTNASTSQATNVVLTSTLPTNSTFVSATTPVGSGTCSQSAGTVTCNWTTIGPGSTYYAYITVTPTAAGSLSLTSTVSAAQSDPNTANNTGTKASTVNSDIDLSISSITGSPDPITLGSGNVLYTVYVYNNSGSQGTNLVLTSTLPSNSTFVSATTPVGSGTCSQSGGTVTCSWASLPAGTTYYAYITVTPTANGVMTLAASVAGAQTDSNATNNSASRGVTVGTGGTGVDLQVYSISGTPDPITLNTGNVTYTVSIYNNSSTTGTNTVLTNTLPANSTFVSTSATNSGTCSHSGSTVTCNWTSILASGFYSATIVVTPTSGGPLTLAASVAGTEGDPNTANNTGNKSVTVNSQIDLQVYSISGSPDPITLNTGNVTYTVQVYNASSSQGTNTVLTNTLPTNSTFVSASATNPGTCSHSGSTVTCNWASIPAGNSYFATIVVTPSSGGPLTLAASVAGTEGDPNTANNTGNKSVTVNSQIDLQVYSVSGSPDPITLNTGNVTYTVQVYNASSTQGTNTVLTNTLPANSTFVSASATNPGTCNQSGSTVTCNWASIPAGTSYFATIVVTPTSGGPLTLAASVAGTETDSNTANNSGSKSVTVNSQIDLQVYNVSGTPDPITLNTGNVTYTVQVYNPSSSQGTNTVLTNTLPSNSTFVSASATNSGTCTHSGSTATCNWASIPAGNSYFATIVVTPTSGGSLTLAANVAGTEGDPNTANNSGNKSVTVNSQIDLQVYNVTGSPDPITLNTGNVTYTVQVYNASSSQGTNTVLTNTLPANSTFVSASATNSGTCTHSGSTVTCNWTSIPAGNSYFATIVVTPTSGGPLTLAANVAGTEGDPNTANNSGNRSVTVNAQIDLQLYSMSGTPDPITLNTGNVTYTVNVYNASSSQGTNTVLTNTLPANSTFVSASATNSGSCTQSGSTVTCNWISIPSTGFYTVTIVVTPTSGGPLALSSSVSGTESDSNTANNNGNKSVTVNSQIDLKVYSVSGSPDPITFGAGNVTFTVYAYNQSSSQGTSVVLTNTLPSNSTYVSSSASNSGTCSQSGSTVTCSWTSIPATTLYSATIVVTPTIAGSLTLSASVAGTQPDPNTADNTLSGTTTVTPTSCTAVPSGAVAWYRAESNGVDSAGPNFATANGGAAYTTGKVGQAFSLNGTSAYVSAPDNASLRPTSLTVEGWFKISGTTGTRMLVSKSVGSAAENSFFVFIASDGTLSGGVGDTTSTDILASTTAPTTGVLHHFAYVYDSAGSAQALYLDGALINAATTSKIIAYDANPLLIGAQSDNSALNGFFSGLIDEVTLYSRALSQTEVQTVYGAGTFGKCFIAPSAPTISGFTPSTGNSGTSVVISGSNFTAVSGVKFNGTPATFVGDNASQITATVPVGATTGTISVITGGGTATSGSSFTAAATGHWINSSGGNWNTASNWSTGIVPTSTTDAVIDANGTYTVTIDANTTVGSVTVGGGATGTQTLSLPANTLVLNGGTSGVTSTGVFSMSGGTLNGGPLTINGTMNWTGGVIDGAGTTNISASGVLNINASAGQHLSGGYTINNAGVTHWTGGTLILDNSSLFNNQATGLFSVECDCTLAQDFGSGTLSNAGAFRKTIATGATIGSGGVQFNNSGTIDILSGTFESAWLTLSTGTIISGTGFRVNSGTVTVAGAASVAVGNSMGITGGILTGTAGSALTVNGTVNWTGGVLDGASGTMNIPSGGVLNINASASQHLSGGYTINNAGVTHWTGGTLILDNSSLFNNQTAGLFSVECDCSIAQDFGAGIFSNAGTFRKTVATGATIGTTGVPFNNSGTIDILSGTFESGLLTLNTGTIITGTGFRVNSGTVTVAGAASVASGKSMGITGGTLTGTAGSALTVNGTVNWTGGVLDGGSGTMTIPTGGVLNINTTAGQHISGNYTINNSGVTHWTGGTFIIDNGSLFNNQAGGLFSVECDCTIAQDFGSGTFSNAGTFRKTVATGATIGTTGVPFNNSGTIDILSGTFESGLLTLNTGTIISGTGFRVNSGTVTVSGAASVAVGNSMGITGGTLTGTAGSALTVNGTVNWTGGVLDGGSGTMTIPTGGVLNINTTAGQHISGNYTINNSGVTHWTGGTFIINNGSLFNNQASGLFSVECDCTIAQDFGSGSFANSGTVLKSFTTGTASISSAVPFDNSGGTIDVRSGKFQFAGTFTQSAASKLRFGIGGSTPLTGYGQLAITGAVNFAGSTLEAYITNAYVPPTSQAFAVMSFGSSSGSFGTKNLTFGSRAFTDSYTSTALTLTADTLTCDTPPSGIVAWYRAEGNAVDSVGTNNGTMNGGATTSAGTIGQAFMLNGTSAYVTAPDSPTLRPANLTIEGWFKFNANSSTYLLAGKPLGTGIDDSFALFYQGGQLKGQTSGGSGGVILSTAFVPTTGVWYHLAYTFNGSAHSLFINGTQVSTGSNSTLPAYDSNPLVIGADIDNQAPAIFFPGQIDELTIYNIALTAVQIADIYNANAAGKCYSASAPTITSFTPTSGLSGTSVVITGTNLIGTSAVAFNGTAAAYTVNSATQITATVPGAATTGTVSATTAAGTATSASNFTVTTPVVHWTNTAGGNWSVGANWSGGVAPTSADTASIDAAGTYTVNLDVTPAFNTLTIGGGATGTQTLADTTTRDITFTNPGTITSSGALTLSSGRLLGPATLTVNGALNWNSDSEIDTTVAIASGAAMNISGAGTRFVNGGTINNSGTINWSGSNNISVYSGGVINNLSGGLFLATNDQQIYQHCCTAGLAFNNAGTFRKTTATGATTILSNGFNNSGSVDIQSGTFVPSSGGTSSGIFNATATGAFLFNNSTYNLTTGATLTGSGNFQIAAGQLNVSASGISVNHMTMTGGNLNITATGAVTTSATGVIDWTADATLSGAGALTISSGGTMNISGAGTRYIDGGTLNNNGTINWSGTNNISVVDSGVINNNGTGLFSVKNDQQIYQHCCSAGQAFNNAGTFQKTVATGTTTILSNGFNNSGTVDIQSGTFNPSSGGTSTSVFHTTAPGTFLFTSNTYTLATGATLTGAGNFQLSSGQLTVNATGVAVDHMTINGGTLNVPGAISTSATGVVDWSADATLKGTGALTIGTGGTLNITGAGTRVIDGGTINNSGTVNWSGANNISVVDSGVINNQSGGLFSVKNDQIIYQHCCSAGLAFNNAGTFRKSVTTGTTTIQSNGFTNTGTVDIQSGTFNPSSGGTSTSVFNAASGATFLFNSSTYTLGTGATLTGSGNFQVSGGTLAVNATGVTVDHLTMNGGTMNVAGSISTSATGVVDWSADAILTGTGALNIVSGGTMNITGAGTRMIGGGTLNNSGTVNWSGTNNISIYDSGIINNQASGLFNVKNDQIIYQHCCSAGQAFNNIGTFRKSVATGTTTIQNNGFTNSGTVDIQSGTFVPSSGGTSTGNFNAVSGATFLFSNSTYTLSSGATLTGSGNFHVGGGTLVVNATGVTVDHMTMTGGTLNVAGSIGTSASGVVDWSADATLTGAGALTIGSGGTMNITGAGTRYIDAGTLNNNGTINWSGANNISVYNAGIINNQNGGTFSVTNDQVIFQHCCSVGQAFNNAGTFRKTVATGTTTIQNNGFANSGTVEADSGVIAFNSGFTSSGSPSYSFGIGSATTYGHITFANPATLTGALIAAPVNSFVPQGGQQFQIITYPLTSSATFSPKTLTYGSSPVRSFADNYITSGVILTASGPTVTAALSPNQGSTAGGTPVTITGNGFVTGGSLGVTFGGSAATSVSVANSTTITCTTPAHATGTVDVVITNGDGQPTTVTNAFTYVVPGTADLGVAASASAGTVANGGTFNYSTIVTNSAGSGTATNVVVTINLPANVTLNGVPSSSQGSCSGTTVITCSLGSLAGSGSATQTIPVIANSAGSAIANASVTATESDPNSANNAASTSVAVTGSGTLTVRTNADSGSGSLRQAVLDANSGSICTSPCTIAFNLPSGQHTIAPLTSIPSVDAASVVIDATTQPGYAGTPIVTLDGTSDASVSRGLQLNGGNDGIKGLSIISFQGSAIVLHTAGNDLITGNYLGIRIDGTTAGQNAGDGITVLTANNTIGGFTAAARNIISGNFGSGVVLKGSTATGNIVSGNYIGLNAAGNATVANRTDGVQILFGASNNMIGGAIIATRNVISGNNNAGVYIAGDSSGPLVCNSNVVAANYIGTDAAGTTALGNSTGVYVGAEVTNSTIGGFSAATANRIVSTGKGISLDGPGDGNVIVRNTITGNSSTSIDLANDGTTANDAGDSDLGANGLQNTPVFVDATLAGSTLTAHVNVDSSAVAATNSILVELFKSDASGTHAVQWLGSQCFAGNALNGVAMTIPSAPVALSDKLVATATSYTDASCGTAGDGTSELTATPATVAACTPPAATITPGGPTTFCSGGSVNLTASVGAGYQWRNFGTPIVGANAQVFNATTSGSYSVTVTNAAGCSATSSNVSVTANTTVSVTITAGGPTTFCSGGSVTLTANPSGGSGTFSSYQWLLNGSPIGGANSVSYSATATGNYSVTVTDSAGCNGTSTQQTVTVNAPPSAGINAPASVCPNSTAGASITSPVGGATYTWSITNGTLQTGQGTSSITFSTGTASPVSISVTASASGCTSNGSASVSVGVFTPTITTSGSPSFCPGGSVTLTSSAAATYQWLLNGSPIGSANGQTYAATVAGSYTVTASNATGCSGTSAPVNVTQSPAPSPTVTAGGPTTFCAGGSVTLSTGGASSYQWLLNGSPIGGANGQSTPATVSGSYSVTVTNATGCSATSAPISVTVNPNPVVTISGPSSICGTGSVTLDAGAGFASYSWSTGASTQTITVSPVATATYSVAVTNAAGCTASASKTVTVGSGSSTTTVVAPSSVTANSTGNSASVSAAQNGSTYNWSITGGTITAGNGTPSIAWTAGASGSVTISVVVTSGSCTATGSAIVAITDSADVTLTATAAPNPVNAGGTVTFTLNVANNGPNAALNVRLTNNLYGVTAPAATGAGWSCATSSLTIVCTAASLASGSSAPLTITATASGSSNAGDDAYILADTSDPNGSNNTASAQTSIQTQQTCSNAPTPVSPAAGAANLANPVTFTWSAPANAISYDLWIASSGAAPAIAATTQTTSATLSLPSGPSTWYVAAHFGGNCPTLFSAPRDLTVAAATNCVHGAPQLIAPSPNAVINSPVTFNWTPVTQAVGYRVWVAIDGGAAQDVGTTNGATSLTVPLAGSSVTWHVDAIFPGCNPTSSALSTFSLAAADACGNHGAPSLLAPSSNAALTSSIVDLHWSAVLNADGYRVWAGINGVDPAPIGTTATATTLHATFSSGTVIWFVEALFNGCASSPSSQSAFTISPAANCNNSTSSPLSPANDATIGNSEVDFSWSSVPNAIGYELWLALNNGTPSPAGSTTTTTLRRTVGAGAVEWFVRAQFNGCAPTDSAHAHFTFAPPADCALVRPILTAPVDGAAKVFSPLNLQWSNVPGATQYKVWLANGDAAPVVIGTTSATHLDNQAVASGSVSWFVEALFDHCPALQSTHSTFTAVPPPPACGTPDVPLPRAESTASTNVEYLVRWTAGGPAATTQYELQESTDAAFTSPLSITVDANEWPFKHINTGDAPVNYHYRVRAVGTCNGARSLFSLPLIVSVLPSNVSDPSSANGSTPADNPQTTHYEIHLGGTSNGSIVHKGSIAAAAGDTFTATTNQPWLTVSPSSGTVAPEGTTLNVTAKTDGLPVGTSSGAVSVTFGSASGNANGNRVALDTKPASTTTVSVNLVQPVAPNAKSGPPPDALIIPAVAHADGVNSKFQSDIRVTNSSAQPMKYQVTFVPTGDTGITQGKQTTVDIDPGRTIALDDVLQSWFGDSSATGTLEVRPLTTAQTSSTTPLPAGLANILTFASSRTYNTTANGTFGQYIPAIPFAAFVGRASDPSKSTILSLQQIAQSPAFRTNLGIVEGSGDPASVLISVFGDNGQKLTEFTQDLKGGQHIQLNSVLAQKNVQVTDGRIEVKVVSPVGKVTAYASVLDNLTNDPLLVSPVAVNQTAAAKYVIPGVADLSNGIANWQTDVRVFNPSTNIVKATLTFFSQNGGTPQSKDIQLAPGQVQTFDATLRNTFGITNDGGALHIATTATTPLVATARTYNQTPNGTYGQFIPAVTANDAAALGTRPLQILQIEESDRYRTNVGFAEVTGKDATIEVTAVPSDSKVAASTQIVLGPNQFIQYPQLLRSMGLSNMYNARISVKVISGQGRVTAYASVIDMQTNDPTFVPAQ